jgi:hypothetical protein
MFENEIEVRPYKVKAWCTQCYAGEMKPTGVMLASMPPKYPHKCVECGYEENLSERYPIIRYKELGKER